MGASLPLEITPARRYSYLVKIKNTISFQIESKDELVKNC